MLFLMGMLCSRAMLFCPWLQKTLISPYDIWLYKECLKAVYVFQTGHVLAIVALVQIIASNTALSGHGGC